MARLPPMSRAKAFDSASRLTWDRTVKAVSTLTSSGFLVGGSVNCIALELGLESVCELDLDDDSDDDSDGEIVGEVDESTDVIVIALLPRNGIEIGK